MYESFCVSVMGCFDCAPQTTCLSHIVPRNGGNATGTEACNSFKSMNMIVFSHG